MPTDVRCTGGFSAVIKSGGDLDVDQEVKLEPKRHKTQLWEVPNNEHGLDADSLSISMTEMVYINLEKQLLQSGERQYNDLVHEWKGDHEAQSRNNIWEELAKMKRFNAALDSDVSSITHATLK